MSGQHTPGPWAVFTTEDEWGCDTFVGTLTDTLFDVRPWKGHSWQEANASLIAAAPDLLEALRGAADMLDRIATGEDWGAIEEQIQDARAAIAKAEGRA